jgi:hypothetical protein
MNDAIPPELVRRYAGAIMIAIEADMDRIKATRGPARQPEPVLWPSPALIRQELDRWFTFIASAGEHDADGN